MKEKFARFMAQRYGSDELNRAISIGSLAMLLISFVIPRKVPMVRMAFWIIALLLIVICYFRMFSKDISARSAENQKFMTFRYSFAVKKQRIAERSAQSKDFKFFKCPKCGVLNRIPKGKGKIEITCPICGEKFIRKS
ncbi:hypothetical protein IMSAG049_01440 [Clostridiales bacterium]|nr:hypothetical protein IMSAG049_01440 [Clostridiales bacterium]